MRRSNHFRWLFVIGLALALLTLSPVSFAQVKSSTIQIVVTDAAGARVPDAAVIVAEQATNANYEARTNSVGELIVPYLPAGNYTVSVKKEGFRPYLQTGLSLASNTTVGVDAVLSVGETQQTVEIVASAVQLQTESSSVQGATTARTIDSLPNLNQNSALLRDPDVGRCGYQGELLRHHRAQFVRDRIPGAAGLLRYFGEWRREPGHRHSVGRRSDHGRRLQLRGGTAERRGHSGSARDGEQLHGRERPRTGRHLDHHQERHQRSSTVQRTSACATKR